MAAEYLAALGRFSRECDNYRSNLDSSCGTELLELIDAKHPLHIAVCGLLDHFPKHKLPHPASVAWRSLCKCSRDVNGDPTDRTNTADGLCQELLDWAEAEQPAAPKTKTSAAGKRGAGRPVQYDRVEDSRVAKDWKAASSQGTLKPDFAASKGITTVELNRLLGRIRGRKRRAK